jgi:hypothetical protein
MLEISNKQLTPYSFMQRGIGTALSRLFIRLKTPRRQSGLDFSLFFKLTSAAVYYRQGVK